MTGCKKQNQAVSPAGRKKEGDSSARLQQDANDRM